MAKRRRYIPVDKVDAAMLSHYYSEAKWHSPGNTAYSTRN
jgi:hypothetical protein